MILALIFEISIDFTQSFNESWIDIMQTEFISMVVDVKFTCIINIILETNIGNSIQSY